jgi:hypothetical protein
MNKRKSLIIAAALLAAVSLHAQTNTSLSIPQDILNLGGDVLDGPWGIATGYGHSITGTGNNVGFEILTYDLLTNVQNTGFSSGIVVGYDQLWSTHQHQFNSLSGGWQFSETGHPLSFIGSTFLTNVVTTEDVFQLVATPNGGSDVGSITGTSVAVSVGEWSGFHGKILGLYESRNGQSVFNGNYLLGGLAITHGF